MTGTKFLLHGDESKNSKMVMMAASSKDDDTISDEEWLVSRARMCIKSDPYAAKSWMITAKSLFPHNFTIQVRLTNINLVEIKIPKKFSVCSSYKMKNRQKFFWNLNLNEIKQTLVSLMR